MKTCVTVMLAVLADHSKLPPYVILNYNIVPKEQLPRGIIFRCQPECCMMNLRRIGCQWCGMNKPGVLIRKWEMLIMDEFKGYLTPEMKATITTGSSMNTDVVVIPGGGRQPHNCRC